MTHHSQLYIVAVLAALSGVACQSREPRSAPDTRAGLLEVTSHGLDFELVREIAAGWTTIRFNNESDVEHFILVEKLPPGKTIADLRTEIVPVFQAAMDLLIEGRNDDAMAKLGEAPAWLSEIVFTGGPGLTSPGLTSEATVYLEPGTYVLECYVKTPDGKFHSYLGMIEQITVTEARSEAAEPQPTLELTIRNDGFVADAEVSAGHHTIAVHFAEQMVHGNFLESDVHLARLEDGSDLVTLGHWMNAMRPAGLTTPAPVRFLGGLHELPQGRTGYMSVNLEPGRYAWIAEVDDPAGKNMLRTFTVGPR